MNTAFWPDHAPRISTLDAFVATFSLDGYAPCATGDFEKGWEKIALYAKDGVPTHAARQLGSGKWTSKLGRLEDIEHDSPELLEGDTYGAVVRFLRRTAEEPHDDESR
jgi:hypothetical protein